MLIGQLARADLLREICNGLAYSRGRLVHVGQDRAPSRSTLAFANSHRPAALFPGGSVPRRLCSPAALFEDVFRTMSARFRRSRSWVKAQVLLDHDAWMPACILLTDARTRDVKMANSFPLSPSAPQLSWTTVDGKAKFRRAPSLWFRLPHPRPRITRYLATSPCRILASQLLLN